MMKMALGIFSIDEVNMTNCCKQRQRFFEKHGSMDCDLLIAYWIMAGYLNPVESVEEAYERGHEVLRKLRHEREIQFLPCGKISTSTTTHPDSKICRHEGHCIPANIELDDLIELQGFEEVTLTNGMLKDMNGSLLLIDGNHLSKYIEDLISSAHRLKCIACFNRMSDSSLNLLLKKVDNPSVLLLRGCESVYTIDFSFGNLNALSVLEISTADEFGPRLMIKFSQLTQLRLLSLSGHASNNLLGEGFSMVKQLRCLILRRCSVSLAFRFLKDLPNLEVLDASFSGYVQMLESDVFCSSKLRVLNLSSTDMQWLPPIDSTAITHLFLSSSSLDSYEGFVQLRSLEVLDLSRCYRMGDVDLSQHVNLVLADLSHTQISSIETVSDMVHLCKLILRDCKNLKGLPQLEKLESLQVLDVCGCELITQLPDLNNLGKLEQLYLSGTRISGLPKFPNPCSLRGLSLKGLELDSLETLGSLLSLVELDLSEVKISSSSEQFKTDFLQSLEKLEILSLSGTSVAEVPELGKLTNLKQLLLANCPCLNTLFDVKVLVNLEKLELPLRGDSSSPWKGLRTGPSSLCKLDDEDSETLSLYGRIVYDPSCFTRLTDLLSKIQTGTTNFNNVGKRQLELLTMDLEYLRRRVESLRKSPDSKTAGELVQHLMDAANSSEDEFTPHSPKLRQLLKTVAKLKLLIPRTQMSIKATMRKKEPKFIISKDRKTHAEHIINKLVRISNSHVKTALLGAYDLLTDNQKECLLCFSVFPWDTEEDEGVLTWQSLVIRKKTLIYWWVGEGFIDHDGENNVATVEESGEEILKVLMEKGFIEPVAVRGRETGRCLMHPFVHTFVTDQAKRSGFFDFSNENSNLTPTFTCSHRAAILKSQEGILSSCQLWRKYSESPEKLKTFESVRTLFSVNESVVYIQPEWFSMMKDLSVLHLGNWHSGISEHIEFGDQKFLEELKNMKKLKLFSLRGVSAVKKLPDSLCELASLMILDLRECHELVELPACIGSLKNLTHLDISNCHLLDKLPKGVSLLSKLEVFKGFAVYEKHSSKEVCSFRDLMKLRNLRELSIVVNQDKFPGIEELKVLEKMLNLRKLKISWITSSIKDERKSDESCGERQVSRREFLGQIEKLNLWCFPSKTAPEWLVPEQLKNLQELHITGGGLQQLHEGIYENVKTLRLRNLPNLMIKWMTLKVMFPELTYLETYKCRKQGRFPCDDQGIWRKGVSSKDSSSPTFAKKPATSRCGFLDEGSEEEDFDGIPEDFECPSD